MPIPARTIAAAVPILPNAQEKLQERALLGRVTWATAVTVLIGRSVFLILAHALVACVFLLLGRSSPWNAAAPWWSVYGNIADLGCLALMVYFTRKEGVRLRDLIGPVKWRIDFFLALLCLAVAFGCFVVIAKPSSLIAFGTPLPNMYPGLLSARVLPGWAIAYSFSVFFLIWSPTEEMTYQGFVLPRMVALARRRWVAVLVVSFWFALQHSFIPFILDWHYVAWRFLAFWLAMAAINLMYLGIRRLPPLILMHWALDVFALVLTLKL